LLCFALLCIALARLVVKKNALAFLVVKKCFGVLSCQKMLWRS
jgi:hypothetical protein